MNPPYNPATGHIPIPMPTSTTQPVQALAFFGASGGVGHFALVASLAAGHTCLALCRDPSKLDALRAQYPSTLVVHRGNAHNITDVLTCLTLPNNSGHLVSAITFTIGNKPDLKKMGEGDPLVCQKGMTSLLEALNVLRREWGIRGQPLLCVVSTTGISETRDIPFLFYPLYHTLLAVPHRDKKVMEGLIAASGERFVLVRPSLLWDGKRSKGSGVRVGIADARTGVVERREVGYTISREAVGEWMFENLIQRALDKGMFEGKAVSLTW
ncbi:hypothetical protein BJY01DRAFT_247473 [Aspergillus pseudoustus]|uniref:NAD(P)-binding domain-containing protein n=1 Tax=Aspergillus pseudoustus TaxID=1810923 RepID=A0ABR4K0K1_9EURO